MVRAEIRIKQITSAEAAQMFLVQQSHVVRKAQFIRRITATAN